MARQAKIVTEARFKNGFLHPHYPLTKMQDSAKFGRQPLLEVCAGLNLRHEARNALPAATHFQDRVLFVIANVRLLFEIHADSPIGERPEYLCFSLCQTASERHNTTPIICTSITLEGRRTRRGSLLKALGHEVDLIKSDRQSPQRRRHKGEPGQVNVDESEND